MLVWGDLRWAWTDQLSRARRPAKEAACLENEGRDQTAHGCQLGLQSSHLRLEPLAVLLHLFHLRDLFLERDDERRLVRERLFGLGRLGQRRAERGRFLFDQHRQHERLPGLIQLPSLL